MSAKKTEAQPGRRSIRDLDFGIFFFASGEDSMLGDKYRLLFESARFADQHGFSSVWVPERHFTPFGCLYPNPALLHAAIATVTERVRLCAGSVVMPLHHPIRVAEEWSVVDNLSHGRIGLALASGWNPDDFALDPHKYPERREAMYRGLEVVRRIWSGEKVQVINGAGRRVEIEVYPSPYQEELPVWLTAAGSPDTFRRAGELGANVLTHLLDQDLETVAEKVSLYRRARRGAGYDPETGIVSVMLHTFVGADAEETREQAREPYCQYLKNNMGLAKGLAHNRGHTIDFDALSDADLTSFLNFLYDRFVFERALIGSPETCEKLVGDLWAIGVDEVACLLDFGPPEDLILENLVHLDELRRRCRELSDETYVRRPIAEEEGAAEAAGEAGEAGEQRPPAALTVAAYSGAADPPEKIRRRCSEELGGGELYDRLAGLGLTIDPALRGLERVFRRQGECLAELAGAGDGVREARLLEACLQTALAALVSTDGEGELYEPAGLGRWRITGALDEAHWCHARVLSSPGASGEAVEAEVRVLAESGEELAQAHGVRLEPAAAVSPEGGGEEGVRDWIYRVAWEASPVAEPALEGEATWLVLADRGGIGEALAEALRKRGQTAVVVTSEEHLPELRRARQEDDVTGSAFSSLLEGLRETEPPLGHVVHLWSLDMTSAGEVDAEGLLGDQLLGTEGVVQLIQAVAGITQSPPVLHVATRGVQPVGSSQRPLETPQSPVWAIGRTCSAEYPALWGGLVDLDPEASVERCAADLLATVSTSDGEDQVAFRDGERQVARLVHCEVEERDPVVIDPAGAYLITGGMQGIGLEVARWLVEEGARHLILIGRTELPPRDGWDEVPGDSPAGKRIAVVREMEDRGVEVRHPAVDVSDERCLRDCLESYRSGGGAPIRGAFHAASVWRNPKGEGLVRPLSQIQPSSFDYIFPAKLRGGWLLSRLLAGDPLDFLFFFSAGAALIGSAGQGNYAAANSFLDCLSHDLQRRGVTKGLSVNWGPILDVGFGLTPEGMAMHGLWERRGIMGITPGEVLEATAISLGGDQAQIGVMRTDWQLLRRSYAEALSAPWVCHLVGPEAVEQVDLLATLEEAEPEDRHDLLCQSLQSQVVAVMGFGEDEAPDFAQGLFELGMDSLLALELKNRIQSSIRHDFPATVVFDYPTIEALSTYLLRDVLALETGAGDAEAAAEEADLLDSIDELSEEEVEKLLAARVTEGEA